jgi:DNA modification methylase
LRNAELTQVNLEISALEQALVTAESEMDSAASEYDLLLSKLSSARRRADQAAVEANRRRVRGQGTATILNQDCVTGMLAMADNSVDGAVSSIPFGALFGYSFKREDIGNNVDGVEMHAGQFALHMRFPLEQLYRVLRPGAVFCCHIQQLNTTQVQHGWQGMRDFRGAVVTLAANHGFEVKGEFVIPKNPQAVAQRRKLHSLLFVTAKRNSRDLTPAMNDYVLLFRKPGEGAAIPGMYDPKLNPQGWFTAEEWIRWACGVWPDIQEIDVLDGWRSARASDEERHVCPLQLEVIRRCLLLYTAPGETVLDPFMGIGSTAYVALEQGRNAVGFELKESYHALALRNLAKAQAEWARAEEDMPLLALAAGE